MAGGKLHERVHLKDRLAASLVEREKLVELIELPFLSLDFVCIKPNGKIRWQARMKHNTVVTSGKNDLLDKYFAGVAYTAAWKLGLKGTAAGVVAGDTLASHAGWTEVTPYAGNRPAIAWSGAAAGSKAASAAVSYAINATATVSGGFLTDQVSGNVGLLYSAGDFTNARSVFSGDTLNVTPTMSC